MIDKSDWKKVKFGDVVNNLNLTSKHYPKEIFDRIIGLDHMDNGSLHISRWGENDCSISFTKVFKKGQTLFAKRRSYQKKIAIAEFDGICSGDILVFDSKDKNVLYPKLIPFICMSDGFYNYVEANSQGSLSPRVSFSALAKYEFLLPPIEEQKRISELLWSIDDNIITHKKIKQNLKVLSYIHFTNLIEKKVIIKSAEHCDVVDDTWRVSELEKSCDIAYGISAAVSSNTDSSIGWPILTGANITLNGNLDLSKIVYIEPPEKERFILKTGDILFNWRSGSQEHVGKTALFSLNGNWTFASFILRIRPDISILNTQYLITLLYYMKRKGIFGSSTTQQINFKLNASILREIPVVIPPLDEQLKIVSVMNHYDEAIDLNEQHTRSIEDVMSNMLKHNLGGAD